MTHGCNLTLGFCLLRYMLKQGHNVNREKKPYIRKGINVNFSLQLKYLIILEIYFLFELDRNKLLLTKVVP